MTNRIRLFCSHQSTIVMHFRVSDAVKSPDAGDYKEAENLKVENDAGGRVDSIPGVGMLVEYTINNPGGISGIPDCTRCNVEGDDVQ